MYHDVWLMSIGLIHFQNDMSLWRSSVELCLQTDHFGQLLRCFILFQCVLDLEWPLIGVDWLFDFQSEISVDAFRSNVVRTSVALDRFWSCSESFDWALMICDLCWLRSLIFRCHFVWWVFFQMLFSRHLVLDEFRKSRKGRWVGGPRPDFHTPKLQMLE